MIGRTIAHYHITAKLGEGGMGVVYKAEDTQLGRQVALKFLPDEFAGQSERLQRFLSEARLASSINHPNIVSIYELGEQDGQHFIAMEYVPGQSLHEVLRSGGLELKKLLALALPASEALASAHRAGVIHRDIKPGNLLVSEDGYPKVADFGLAKLKVSHDADATLTHQASTEPGKIVGTLAYMSPDQLEGREIDARSDVFSFGVVLYEMATGISPFLRNSAASTTAAILRDSPEPVRKRAKALPGDLDRIIEKAIEKDPDFRYQSMDEMAADLKRLRRDLEAGRLQTIAEPEPGGPAFPWAKAALWAAGGATVAAVVIWSGLGLREEAAPPVPTRMTQLTSLPGLEDSPTWSPDGRSIAYVSDEAGGLNIYVQQVAGGRAIRLTESDADDTEPAWSPDGSRIAFVSARSYPEKRLGILLGMGTWQAFFAGANGDVWLMPALGGPARRLAREAYSPAWSPDGKRLVYQALRDGRWGLWVQEVEGVSEVQALEISGLEDVSWGEGPDASVLLVVAQPDWSPDGKWIAFTGGRNVDLRIFVVPSTGGKTIELAGGEYAALMPSWSPDGRWLYFSSNRSGRLNLWRARFQNGRLGSPVQVTAGGGEDLRTRLDPGGTRLAYSRLNNSSDIWEYNLQTNQATQVTSETTLEDIARPSPNGRWLAFASSRLNGNHLWLLNRDSRSLARVTTTPSPNINIGSYWSRDGKHLFYVGSGIIWRYEISTGDSRRVAESQSTIFCLSPDDRYLVLAKNQPTSRIVRVDLSTEERVIVTEISEGFVQDPACSPDGQTVAFHVQQGNLRKLWVVPVAGGEARQVTFGESEDSHPVWSTDSRSIYFIRDHMDIYVIPAEGGEPRPVTNYHSFTRVIDYPAVTPDGKRVMFTRWDKTGDIFILETPEQ